MHRVRRKWSLNQSDIGLIYPGKQHKLREARKKIGFYICGYTVEHNAKPVVNGPYAGSLDKYGG